MNERKGACCNKIIRIHLMVANFEKKGGLKVRGEATN
jgi:hypothetical protein